MFSGNAGAANTKFSYVSAKNFGIKNPKGYYQGQRNKDKYISYRNEYREAYGVFPELDRINFPFIAKDSTVYDFGCELLRKGFYGAWFFHDLHGHFNKRFKKIYEKYLNEMSVLALGDYDSAQRSGEHIVNDLGYRLDDNGIYSEGTWQDGCLVYGYIIDYANKIKFIGSIDRQAGSLYRGVKSKVVYQGKKSKHRKSYYLELMLGTFINEGNDLVPYDSTVVTILMPYEENDAVMLNFGDEVHAYVGDYVDKYQEGIEYGKSIINGSEIKIGYDKYKDGECIGSMGGLSAILHLFLGVYMMIYYAYKYLLFWIVWVPYRMNKKKKMKL